MATTTESIVIKVTDSIPTRIATKIQQIADKSIVASTALQTFTAKAVDAAVGIELFVNAGLQGIPNQISAIRRLTAEYRLAERAIASLVNKRRMLSITPTIASYRQMGHDASFVAIAQDTIIAQIPQLSALNGVVSRLARSYDLVTAAITAANFQTKKLAQSNLLLMGLTTSLTNIRQAYRDIVSEIDAAVRRQAALNGSARSFSTRHTIGGGLGAGGGYSSRDSYLGGAIGEARHAASGSLLTGQLMSAAIPVAGVLALSNAYANLQNKLRVVADSEGQVNELTKRLGDIAYRTRASIESTAGTFARFDTVMKLNGKSQEETLRLTETMNKLFTVGGANATEFKNGLMQLGQSFNSGKLNGDEFRTAIETLPKIFQTTMANVKGIKLSELKNYAKDGKLGVDDLIETFYRLNDYADKHFDDMTVTIAGGFEQLRTKAIITFGEFDKGVGITKRVVTGFRFLGDHIREIVILMGAIGAAITINITRIAITALGALLTTPWGLFIAGIAAAAIWVDKFGSEMLVAEGKTFTWKDKTIAYLDIIKEGFQTTFRDIKDGVLTPFYEYLTSKTGGVNPLKQIYAPLTWLSDKTGLSNLLGKVDNEVNKKAQIYHDKNIPEDTTNSLRDKNLNNALAHQREMAEQAAIAQEKLDKKLSKSERTTKSYAKTWEDVNRELDQSIMLAQLLPDSRGIESVVQNIQDKFKSDGFIVNNGDLDGIRAKVLALKEMEATQKEIDSIYSGSSIKALQDMNVAVNAANELYSQVDDASGKRIITLQERNAAIELAREKYRDLRDPLRQTIADIKMENDVLTTYGEAQDINNKVVEVSNILKAKGRKLTNDQASEIANLVVKRRELNQVNIEANQIYQNNVVSMQQYKARLQAINEAQELSSGQKAIQTIGTQGEMSRTRLGQGRGNLSDVNAVILAKQMESYKGAALGATEALANFNDTVMSGTVDAMVQAATGTNSFMDSMRNLATGAINTLTSELIKLGIQLLVIKPLMDSFGGGSPFNGTGAQKSFGNAAGGSVLSMIGQYGAKLFGYADGGYTGNYGKSTVAGVVHGQEYVVNASATRKNKALLDKMNNGGTIGGSSVVVNKAPVINIENYGTSKEYDVQVTEDQVRIIAKDEASKAASKVERNVPSVVAANLNNPNSKISKAYSNRPNRAK